MDWMRCSARACEPAGWGSSSSILVGLGKWRGQSGESNPANSSRKRLSLSVRESPLGAQGFTTMVLHQPLVFRHLRRERLSGIDSLSVQRWLPGSGKVPGAEAHQVGHWRRQGSVDAHQAQLHIVEVDHVGQVAIDLAGAVDELGLVDLG
jgi:hypothetical protein